MGSPWGPTLASAFSCHDEKEWLNSCTTELKPKVYKRYVDDIFVMFQSRDHIKRFVEIKPEQVFILRYKNYYKHSEKIIWNINL